MYLASGDALYVADLTGLPTVTAQLVYMLPGPDRSFSSIAVSPDGSTVYLGGDDLTPSGAPRQRHLRFQREPGGACSTPSGQAPLCEWDAPSGDAVFDGGITSLALTPNGRDLFAVNNAGFSEQRGFRIRVQPAFEPTAPGDSGDYPASRLWTAGRSGAAPGGHLPRGLLDHFDPSGTDVYVGSESLTANEDTDATVTGFPVASVTSNVAAANLEPTGVDPPASLVNTTILQTCPNGDSCPLFFNDQLNVSISMSADGKDLVVAMPSYQFVGVEEISEGTLLDSVPVQPNGAAQPNIYDGPTAQTAPYRNARRLLLRPLLRHGSSRSVPRARERRSPSPPTSPPLLPSRMYPEWQARPPRSTPILPTSSSARLRTTPGLLETGPPSRARHRRLLRPVTFTHCPGRTR